MVKRVVDVVIAGVALVALSPVLAAVAALVRLRLGRPVIFRQTRAGLAGASFEILKFRTMEETRDLRGGLLADADRLTPFGRTLRASSLDELPELWNVLRGDMSLIGPRPLPSAYLSRYTAEEGRRHEIRPGITGWAQAHGRNSTSWEDRLAMDIWYVDNRSLRVDLLVLRKTVSAVLGRTGISHAGEATMAELRPSDPGRR